MMNERMDVVIPAALPNNDTLITTGIRNNRATTELEKALRIRVRITAASAVIPTARSI
jgi:hypothetical protein